METKATGLEQKGQGMLGDMLANGIPEQYKLGDDALKDFLQNSTGNIMAQFDPFKARADRQIAESEQAHKRAAGVTGNLYSTDTVKRLGDIQNRGNETIIGELARLTKE